MSVEQFIVSPITPEWMRVFPLDRLDPRKFENVFAVNVMEELELQGRKLYLNGRQVEVSMVCFQGNFDETAGLVRFHSEGVEPGHEGEYELFWPIAGGGGSMYVSSETSGLESDNIFHPILTPTAASGAKYELAVATDMATKLDSFQINVTVGEHVYQPQCIVTPPGSMHSTLYDVGDVLMGIALKYKYI